jgi:predicted permease
VTSGHDTPRRTPFDDPRRHVRDEIDFHIEKQVAELVAKGWTEEHARAEAIRRFGDAAAIEQALVRRAQRKSGRMKRTAIVDEMRAHLGFAVRQIRRRPAFAAAAVALLGAGIGLGTATFMVAYSALVQPLPFPQPEQLVFLHDLQGDDGYEYLASFPEIRDWAEGSPFLSSVAGVSSTTMVLARDVPAELEVGWMWGDWVEVVGLPLIAGRGPTPDELVARAPVVLLDEEAWQEWWSADPGLVGGAITLDDDLYTVIGVLPSEARLLADRSGVDLWMIMPELEVMGRGFHFMDVRARLAPGVTFSDAELGAESLADRLRETGVTRHGIRLQPAHEAILGDTRPAVAVLIGAALLVLLVLCINLAMLFATRTEERLGEFAVRGALGAESGRIVRQVLTEVILLGIFAGALGALAARGLTGVLATARPGPLEAAVVTDDVLMLAFAIALAVGSALLVCWGPARRATGLAPGTLLVGGLRHSARAHPLRRLMIASEVALSVILLVSAGLLLRSVDRLLSVDPGFQPRGGMTAWITLPESRYPVGPERVQLWDDLFAQVSRLPGVQSAGAIDLIPLGGSNTSGGFEIVGRDFPEEEGPSAKKRFTGPGALEALGIPLLQGRYFTDSDALGAPEVAVISRSLAERWWPAGDAVGQRIRFLWRTDGEQEIVGVVEDVRSDALDVPEEGTIYVNYRQLPIEAGAMSLVVRTSGAPTDLVEPIRRIVLDLAPTVPLSAPRSLEDLVDASVSERTRITGLLSTFAGVALALAALGLYAVTARSVGSRKREIGIRKAMGAGRASILGMVIREEAPPVAIGLVLGIAASLPAARVLGGLLYATEATDPVTLVAVCTTLAAAALAALLVPAWRATRIPPAIAVRD